jgi:hypothetical protein
MKDHNFLIRCPYNFDYSKQDERFKDDVSSTAPYYWYGLFVLRYGVSYLSILIHTY